MSLLLSRDPFFHPFWSRDFFTTPATSEDIFELNLDVEQFKPEEITIKLTENNVVIVEGKHEEKKDENGSISRHFVKKCVIPKEYDVRKIQSKLYSNGILSISAPKIKSADDKKKVRDIPIMRVKGDGLKSKL